MERSTWTLAAAVAGVVLANSPMDAAQATSFRPTVSGAVERTLDRSTLILDGLEDWRGEIMLVRGARAGSSGSVGRAARTAPPVQVIRPPVAKSSRTHDTQGFNIGGNVYTGLAAAQAALAAFVPESAINALAVGQYSGMLQTSPVIGPDKALHHEVHNIVKWLLDHNPQIDSQGWEVHVINDPNIVNAWCMPGMKMAVYTKLIERMGNDVALVAAVMAHEIAHAELKHGYRQVRERLLLSAAHTYVLGKTNSLAGSLAVALGGNAVKALTMADASRDHEDEADERALYILKNAGYDPRLMIRALQRLAGPNAKTEAGLLDSHPAIAERVARLERIIAQM